jgi:hypothetical protein
MPAKAPAPEIIELEKRMSNRELLEYVINWSAFETWQDALDFRYLKDKLFERLSAWLT